MPLSFKQLSDHRTVIRSGDYRVVIHDDVDTQFAVDLCTVEGCRTDATGDEAWVKIEGPANRARILERLLIEYALIDRYGRKKFTNNLVTEVFDLTDESEARNKLIRDLPAEAPPSPEPPPPLDGAVPESVDL